MANLTLAPEDDFDGPLVEHSRSKGRTSDLKAVHHVRQLHVDFDAPTECGMNSPWPRSERPYETKPGGKQNLDKKHVEEESQ
jgi:hypothetical protein